MLAFGVKGVNVGDDSHGTDWETYTLRIPEGTYEWQQVSVTLETGEETRLELGLNVVNVTEAPWVDDVELSRVDEGG